MTGKVDGGVGSGESDGQLELQEDEMMALEAILPPTEFSRKTTATRLIPEPTSSPRLRRIWLSIPTLLPAGALIDVQSHIVSQSGTSGRSPSERQANGERPSSSLESEPIRLSQSSKHVDPSGAWKRSMIYTTTVEGIAHLPPMKLLVDLPCEYPNDAPPRIVHISADYLSDQPELLATSTRKESAVMASLTASWRSKVLSWVKDALIQQWEEMKGEILYSWYEYLKEGLWQDIFDGRAAKDCPLLFGEASQQRRNIIKLVETLLDSTPSERDKFQSPLVASLKAHDLVSKRKEFEGERFGCGICLEDKRGGKCYKIGDCGHVFCQDCLTSYLSSMIREGYIRQASNCPDPECVKARVAAENESDGAGDGSGGVVQEASPQSRLIGHISQEEMLKFVGDTLVKRLHRLQEKALASTDPTAGYCPRPGCENLVRGDARDIGTMYEQMRICDCGYTYCLYCSKAWHGKSPCNLVSSATLIERYKQAAENGMVRREMELKYGKTNLERMVRTYEEEMENKRYIDNNTQRCPCCSVAIEKSMGCNHMACQACKTHFCYRCGTRLNAKEPYRHFNTPGLNCYNKLFDAVGSVDGPGAAAAADWAFIGADEEEMALWEAEQL